MESRLILDFQISVSSSKYSHSGPDKGRLNLNYTFNTTTSEVESYGGWIAAEDDSSPWLQVDFITNVTISGIATQGEDEGTAWTMSYEISYGDYKHVLQDYHEDGLLKVNVMLTTISSDETEVFSPAHDNNRINWIKQESS